MSVHHSLSLKLFGSRVESCRPHHNATLLVLPRETKASPRPPRGHPHTTRRRRRQSRRCLLRHGPLLPLRGGALRRHAVPGALPVDARRHPGPAQEAAPGRHLRGRQPHRDRGDHHVRQLLRLPQGEVPQRARPPRRHGLHGAPGDHHGRPRGHHGRPAVALRGQAADHGARRDGALGGHHQPADLPGGLLVPEGRRGAALHGARHPPHRPDGQQLARHGQEAARRHEAVDGDGERRAAAVHGVRAGGEGWVPAVGAARGPAAAAGAGVGHQGERGGGQGRERGVHDGVGGGGGGADQLAEQVRDLHQGRGVHGERGGGEEPQEHHVHWRRHGQDGDQGQPQRRRRLHHLPLRHSRCGGQQLPGPRPDHRERGRPVQAPGGGAPRRRRPLGVLSVQLRGLPGHPLCALPPAVLPRVRHLRYHRLCLWQFRRGAPELQPLRAPPPPQPEQHLHGAGPDGPQPEHRHLHPEVQGGRRLRPRRRAVQLQDLPRSAVEAVLAHRVHAVGARQRCQPRRLARVGRHLRARHALLRRVPEHGPRRRHVRPGDVEGVPRHHQRVRGQHLHGWALHRRRRMARRHIHPILRRVVSCDRPILS